MGFSEEDVRKMMERVEQGSGKKKVESLNDILHQEVRKIGDDIINEHRKNIQAQEDLIRDSAHKLDRLQGKNTLLTGLQGADAMDKMFAPVKIVESTIKAGENILLLHRLYMGEKLNDEQMYSLGFVRIDGKAMGAVRTTKNIAVMSLERIKSESNKRSKVRWLAYCAYKDRLRAAIGVREACTRMDVVVELEPPVSWRKCDRIAKMDTLCTSKPDIDNIAKGIMDACMSEDKGVGIIFGAKWWSIRNCMWVRMV